MLTTSWKDLWDVALAELIDFRRVSFYNLGYPVTHYGVSCLISPI